LFGNLGTSATWNPLDLSRPVKGQLYLLLYTHLTTGLSEAAVTRDSVSIDLQKNKIIQYLSHQQNLIQLSDLHAGWYQGNKYVK
jgi:hypothetical protein